MERNFPVIPIFRNFRPTSRGTPKISEWNSGKCLFHSLPNPEFPEFLVEWKVPRVSCKSIHSALYIRINKWWKDARDGRFEAIFRTNCQFIWPGKVYIWVSLGISKFVAVVNCSKLRNLSLRSPSTWLLCGHFIEIHFWMSIWFLHVHK